MRPTSPTLLGFATAALGVAAILPRHSRGQEGASPPWLARLSEFGQRSTDGRFGFLLKRANGPTLLDLHADETFEPASAIKALIHVHAMRLVQVGAVTLDEPVRVAFVVRGSCPIDAEPRDVPMRAVLRAMMQESNNAAAQALRATFGDAALHDTAQALRMSKTVLRHRIGCADGTDGAYENPNATTLHDLARLYETLESPGLAPEVREAALQLMLTSSGPSLPSPLQTIITQEAAAAHAGNELAGRFATHVRVTQKGGNYDWHIGVNEYHHQARAGLVLIPMMTHAGDIAPQSYVFGAFVNDASDEAAANHAAATLYWECLREPIRLAIRSWTAAARRLPADLDNGSGNGTPDAIVDLHDLTYYLDRFAAGDLASDLDDGSGSGTPDGSVTIDDLIYFETRFEETR